MAPRVNSRVARRLHAVQILRFRRTQVFHDLLRLRSGEAAGESGGLKVTHVKTVCQESSYVFGHTTNQLVTLTLVAWVVD